MLVATTMHSWEAVKPLLISAVTELPAFPKSLDDLSKIYLNEDPLVTAVWFCLFCMFECWLTSVITGDFSQGWFQKGRETRIASFLGRCPRSNPDLRTNLTSYIPFYMSR
jgi:hypothetical protein